MKFKPSPAMVVALIALFVSASGVTWAATSLPRDSVGSKQIVNGSIKDKDLGENSVDGKAIADDAVEQDEIALDAVNSDEIATDAVGSDEIMDDSVGSDELGEGSVGASEVAGRILTEMGDPVPVEGGTAENNSYRIETATVTCADGEQVIGGFAQWDPDDADDNEYELTTVQAVVDPDAETVTVEGGNDSGVDHDLYAVAICLT